jgi:AcrR family transcriptional regulator
MARVKDEKRRAAIISGATKLFARNGFYNTSISDIVKETGFPVGSIYTYFKSKEDLVTVIIEEGWQEFRDQMMRAIESERDPEKALIYVVDRVLPQLLENVDLVNIILSEAVVYANIESKIDEVTTVIFSIIRMANKNPGAFDTFPRKSMETGIIIYFMGILNALRIGRMTNLDISAADAVDFVKSTIRSSMNLKL